MCLNNFSVQQYNTVNITNLYYLLLLIVVQCVLVLNYCEVSAYLHSFIFLKK